MFDYNVTCLSFGQLLYQQILWNTELSPKPWDNCLGHFQGSNQMGLCAPLVDSKTNNSSEASNFHQNLDIIALKKKGMNSMCLSAPFVESKTNNSYETPNGHKNLEVISLDPVNQLVITSATTQP